MPAMSANADPRLSTETDAFSQLLGDLQRTTGDPGLQPEVEVLRPVVLLRAPGDLVVLAGVGRDALVVADAFAERHERIAVTVGGSIRIPGSPRVDDARSALAARARGRREGLATVVAWGVEAGMPAAMRADQVWAVVDASRKPLDTKARVGELREAVPVQAMAVLGLHRTSTPDTLRRLGLRQGWTEHLG
jgi:hypothetical protein